jgi:hypothetical protein
MEVPTLSSDEASMNALYIVATYVVLDDALKAQGYQDDVRATVTTAEVLTVAVVAARFFQNHHERALCILQQLHALPRLSLSRFNRRLHHALPVFEELLAWLSPRVAQPWLCIIDTLPIPVCKRARAERCQKVHGKSYWGWAPAKKEWFYGFRLHWLCDPSGIPLAFALVPATWHELSLLHDLTADLPPHTCVLGDAAYVSRREQQLAWQAGGIYVIAQHHQRMRPNLPEEQALLSLYRKQIETAHSQLEKMGVQRLHTRSLAGLVLKLLAALFALLLNALV